MTLIHPIGSSPRPLIGQTTAPALPAPKPGELDFPGMLQTVLGQLNDLAKTADAKAAQAAAGEDVDLHELMIALETAGLGFQLALQVRNKLVEAYQEITRMAV